MTHSSSSPESTALSPANPDAAFTCGDMRLAYHLHAASGQVELRLLPMASLADTVPPRDYLRTLEIELLPASALPIPARRGVASLVQLKLAEDDLDGGFAGGRSMRPNRSVASLRFESQEVAPWGSNGIEIRTRLVGHRGLRCVHIARHEPTDQALVVQAELTNTGDAAVTVEMLSSFCLGNLSPFDAEDAVDRLRLHRFRSLWSYEGRHDAVDFEDLHLERSWMNASVVNERFGQVGSMPVRGWFPFAAIEDKPAGVFWAAQLACPGSWQMEVYRTDDRVTLSGGLADREFGHWTKRLAPGDTLATPPAFLTTAAAVGIDALCQRLVRMQEKPLAALPALENDLPILFNEWCSSWGLPTPAFIATTAKRLAQTPVRIFVIDDGWAEKPDGAGQFNGDWNVERRRFPDGLRPVADGLRAHGFTPGLWFEFEVCTEGTDAFKLDVHKLRRDGRTLRIGSRHFWDFTDPWTFDYLSEKVIARLRDDGFGYLKVDYNETLGLGCDHPDSLGEGLRLHLEGVQRFFRRLREELPRLIIEVCSSGGHRLEPSFLALAAMGSFSDAHECPEIPIVAANLHRLILPRQNQIWAVLHASDTPLRLHYSLAATFLGRCCLSGEIEALSASQFEFLQECLAAYERVKHLIRDGESVITRETGKSWRRPTGWQVVTRTDRKSPSPTEALVVVHAFGQSAGSLIPAPLPAAEWRIIKQQGVGMRLRDTLEIEIEEDFSSMILHCAKRPATA